MKNESIATTFYKLQSMSSEEIKQYWNDLYLLNEWLRVSRQDGKSFDAMLPQ
jgi:hypothetical protein